MLYPEHRGTCFRVRMMSWDSMGRDRTLAVVDSKEAADALVDKYSEQYPNAYIDYTNSL